MFRNNEESFFVQGVHVVIRFDSKFTFLKHEIELSIRSLIPRSKYAKMFTKIVFILKDHQEYFGEEVWHQIYEAITFVPKGDLGHVDEEYLRKQNHDNGINTAYVHLFLDVHLNLLCKNEGLNSQSLSRISIWPEKSKSAREIVETEIMPIIKGKFAEFIMPTIEHELYHNAHLIYGKVAQRRDKIIGKARAIEARLRPLIISMEKLEGPNLIPAARQFMEEFMRGLFMEGLATYYQKLLSDQAFREMPKDKLFQNLHEEALHFARNSVLSSFTMMLLLMGKGEYARFQNEFKMMGANLRKLQKEIYYNTYTIGLHMVYTIYYAIPEIQDMLKFSIAEFVRAYEIACRKVKIRPLVSLTSGEGEIFDYKEALRRLHRAEKQLKRGMI